GPPRCRRHLQQFRDDVHDLILAGIGTELIAIEPAVAAFPLHPRSQGILAKWAIAHVSGSFAAINVACSPRVPAVALCPARDDFRRCGTGSVGAPLYVDGSPQALPLPSQARLHEDRGAERQGADQAGPIPSLRHSEARGYPAPLRSAAGGGWRLQVLGSYER